MRTLKIYSFVLKIHLIWLRTYETCHLVKLQKLLTMFRVDCLPLTRQLEKNLTLIMISSSTLPIVTFIKLFFFSEFFFFQNFFFFLKLIKSNSFKNLHASQVGPTIHFLFSLSSKKLNNTHLYIHIHLPKCCSFLYSLIKSLSCWWS